MAKKFRSLFYFGKHFFTPPLSFAGLTAAQCVSIAQTMRMQRITNCPKRKFPQYNVNLVMAIFYCCCSTAVRRLLAATANAITWQVYMCDFARLRVIRFSVHSYDYNLSMKINGWLWWWREWWRPFKNNKFAKSSICSAFESIFRWDNFLCVCFYVSSFRFYSNLSGSLAVNT